MKPLTDRQFILAIHFAAILVLLCLLAVGHFLL